LSLENITLIFERLRKLGVVRLGLLGGEPMVRSDFGEIVALAKEMGFVPTVNSNLTLYDRFPNVLDPVDMVFTSLDGDPQTHIAARGEKSLDGVLEAISDLRHKGKQVIVICVVTGENLSAPDYLINLARELGFKVHFQPQCMDTEIVRGALPVNGQDADLRAFWRKLLRQKENGAPIASSHAYLKSISQWHDYSQSTYYDAGSRCAAGSGFLFVDPQGRAYPCAYTKGYSEPVDLLHEDWQEKFTGETPCTRCIVGPMHEFNLLFRRPVRQTLDIFSSYIRD